MRQVGKAIGGLLASAILGATPALAGEVDDAIAAAIQDVEQGRCDAAYGRLSGWPSLEHRARLLAGQCRIRQGHYPEALVDLDRARGAADLMPEQIGDVELYRGVALYHLERYTEASAALDRAAGLTSEEAQLELYRGLIALRDGDSDRAAPSLERAARLSPDMTEPVASYYAGLAWQGVSERTKAREAFRRVVEIDGDGPWAREARKMLDATSPYPYWVTGKAGFEYDDNVLLRGGVSLAVPPGLTGFGINGDGEKDWRGVWQINGGVQLFEVDDWSGGLLAGYSGNAHFDLSDFNLHYPTIGAYLARRIDSATTAQARYEFGHGWIDESPFIQSHIGELSLTHDWRDAGTSVLVADLIWNDVRFTSPNIAAGPGVGGPCAVPTDSCGPAGVNENRERDRDGLGVGSALEHRYPIALPVSMDEVLEGLDLAGGYRFRYFHSQGKEWKHFAHVFSAGLAFDFPAGFDLDTRASYEFRDFVSPSTFPDRETVSFQYGLSDADRKEHEVRFDAELAKAITTNLSVSVRYSYLENESNRRVFDYTRHLGGAYVNFRFD
ncbi:MAG: tetratricopeptide repeat protein [Spirochaetaceae bacterium]|nr:tetratricopeptide repeat protein [Myxococcales bacterium]MCB9722523.1 tetratricopeptide repeat protein [Spirochaetaceae bacterium]